MSRMLHVAALALVGVGAAMRPEDVLFTVYREIGTKFWRGVSLLDILLYWGGDERGTRAARQATVAHPPQRGQQTGHRAGARGRHGQRHNH